MGHGEKEDGEGERGADPQAARHVAQFTILRLGGGDGFRFEGHAAFGASAGMILLDLGMHRAGVDERGAGGCGG